MVLLLLLNLFFPTYISAFILIFAIFTILIDAALIMDNRTPHDTWAWLLLFLLVPIIGWGLFLLVGRHQRNFFSRKNKLLAQRLGERLTQSLKSLQEKEEARIREVKEKYSGGKRHLLRLAKNGDYSLMTLNNEFELLQNADKKYGRLLEDIEAAEKSIHLQYFEWHEDTFTQKLKALLIQKAQQGVDIRILIDAFGNGLSKKYRQEMRDNGIDLHIYLRYHMPYSVHTINYRNHRKIIVIDGEIGYMGGINMGQLYLDGGDDFTHWRDTHIRLRGESVAALQGVFVTSWYNTTEEELSDESCFPPVHNADQRWPQLPVQITTSGPDSDWQVIKQIYFAMILDADEHVYIQSPFFIPDQAITESLTTAALSGIDVKLMIAAEGPDHRTPYWAANTYFADLAKAGIEIYLYKGGYLHAKTVNIDNKICSIGSANFDIRSFDIDYEITALIYDEKIAEQLAADFHQDMQSCEKFDLEQYNNRSRVIHLRDSAARLAAPLL